VTNKISRTTYFDPAEVRAHDGVVALAIGAVVIYAAADEGIPTRLYITHVEEIGQVAIRDNVHQTCVGKWLEKTVAPRAAPVAGVVVRLA
jgi:hypothetical protein